jgi:hypothetical protein
MALGDFSHAEGCGTTASGDCSHTEGEDTTASNDYAHGEGYGTVASGIAAHAEGYETTASGSSAHAEGTGSIASGDHSHAEGDYTTASGKYSHAEGVGTTANHASQHVIGEFNVLDTSSANATNRGNYVEIVGNGTGTNNRSNARTLDWSGNEVLNGSFTSNLTTDNNQTRKVQIKLYSPAGSSYQYESVNFSSGQGVIYNLNGLHLVSDLGIFGKVRAYMDGYGEIATMNDGLIAYPIGSIYLSVNSTSPASLFGGEWTQLKGRFLLGAGPNEANTDTTYGDLAASVINRSVDERGGEASHTLTIDEMPEHNHSAYLESGPLSGGSGHLKWSATTYQEYNYSMGLKGGSQPHNNMPPYLVVYMWKRTA